jgi:hypothetical protein
VKLYIATAALLATAAAAHANPRNLPVTYNASTSARGHLEVEQFVDAIGVRLERELDDGTAESTMVPRYELQTELEYGLTDRLEYGLYFAFKQGASVDTPVINFAGVKNRLRWRFSRPEWPVQMAAYGEVATFHDEVELEEKLILDYRAGRVRAQANLWIEQEWYFVDDETKYVYNPAAGVTYEVSPAITLGAEYWARGRFDEPAMGGTGTHHYAGPTFMAQRGEYWISAGAYTRLEKIGSATDVDDPNGKLWVRLVAGIGL